MTARDVYESAVVLIDDIDTDGTLNEDTASRAPYLIDLLHREIAMREGRIVVDQITDLDDELIISNDSAMRIMPYGLAMHLILPDRNADMFNTFESNYQLGLRSIKRDEEEMTDVYNILSGMQ